MALAGAQTAGSLIKPGEAEAYHFCGHICTTDSCPHPTGLPRIDSRGLPLRAKDGHRVDDLGRLVDQAGNPVVADARVQGGGRAVRHPDRHRRRVVPLLRRPGAQARGLLLLLAQADQRRRRPDGLLLQGPQGVLRHVLPDQGPVLEALLLAAGLVAGVTGAWSPCCFSMVDTLAPHGYAGRMRTTLVACATFAAGAVAGGGVTFGGLARLRQALGAGSLAVAAAIALAAAAGEARGARIVPQGRRQVPESWRRVLPVPLAAGLYGVLLGLGFTTFILTFAVWALAAVSVALGDPALGAVLGLAFGAGRALPVIALAPVAGTGPGAALHAAMAERPQILRSLRAVDALALAACAVVLVA